MSPCRVVQCDGKHNNLAKKKNSQIATVAGKKWSPAVELKRLYAVMRDETNYAPRLGAKPLPPVAGLEKVETLKEVWPE